MMTDKTFILGIGAQKAGTTWLSRYLASSPGVAGGQMKEYHIWDALHLPSYAARLVPRARLLQTIRHRLRLAPQSTKHRNDLLRRHMQNDTQAYFDYFADLLAQPGKHLAYDITPAYAGLPADVFRQIADGFSQRGVNTKVIFLLRDPVEACWSAARGAKYRHAKTTDVTGDEVLKLALSQGQETKRRYHLTCATLGQVFTANQIYTGLYEEMHQQDRIEALSRFCGLPARFDMSGERVNARPKMGDIEEAIKAQIARHYRPVYEQIAAMLPQARQLWPGFHYL